MLSTLYLCVVFPSLRMIFSPLCSFLPSKDYIFFKTSNIASYVKVYLALFSCPKTMYSLRPIQMLYAKTFMPLKHEISGFLLLFCNGTWLIINFFVMVLDLILSGICGILILCFELELCLILVLSPEAFIVVNLKKIFFRKTQYFPWGSEVCWSSDLFCAS